MKRGVPGFTLVAVTNQSGIARGLYGEHEYHAVAKRPDDLLAEAELGLNLADSYYVGDKVALVERLRYGR